MRRLLLLLPLVLSAAACGRGGASPGSPSTSPLSGDASLPDVVSPGPGPTTDAGTDLPGPRPFKPVGWPELQTSLPSFDLRMAPADWDALIANLDDRDYWVPATFSEGKRSWAVQVRIRGQSTRKLPKKGFSIEFPDTDRYSDGRKRLELIAAWKDAGYLTEKLWFDYAAYLGLRVSRVRYVNLDLNGSYHGVMTEIEKPSGKAFLAAHGFDLDADIYRCGMHDCEMKDWPPEDYQLAWEKKTNESKGMATLDRFLAIINRTPNHLFAKELDAWVEGEDLLTWMALDALISMPGYEDTRSYWILDRRTRRWSFTPWDLNNSLSLYNRTNSIGHWPIDDAPYPSYTPYNPMSYGILEYSAEYKPAWSVLFTRILDDPSWRARYRARLAEILRDHFSEEVIGPRVDAAARLLAPHVARDPWVLQDYAARSAGYLRWYVRSRREWLVQHAGDLDAHGRSALLIDRVGRDAAGAWWVQIVNSGAADLALGDLFISGELRVPRQARLPARTLRPGQTLTLRAGAADPFERLGATLDASRPEVGLFAPDPADPLAMTALDLTLLPVLQPGECYGRVPRGAEAFGPCSGP